MDLRHLETFAAVAELRSFTRAAENHDITQGAVSQHIAALERELNSSLFTRGGRAVELTDSGRKLYEYARRILDLLEEAKVQVGQTKRGIRGRLRIASSSVPAESVLPELLAQFRQEHPDVVQSVAVSDSQLATEAVQSGTADVGFVGDLPRSLEISAVEIATDELVLVVAPNHPFAERHRATIAKLREEPLIIREPGSGSRRCVEKELEAQGLSPGDLNVVMEINSNDAIRAAVAGGAGVAFLSEAATQYDLGNGRLVKVAIQGFHPRRRLYMISDPQRVPSGPARALIAFVNQARKNGKA